MLHGCFHVNRRIAVAALQGQFQVDAKNILFVASQHPFFADQSVDDIVAVELRVVPYTVSATVTGVEQRTGDHVIKSFFQEAFEGYVNPDIPASSFVDKRIFYIKVGAVEYGIGTVRHYRYIVQKLYIRFYFQIHAVRNLVAERQHDVLRLGEVEVLVDGLISRTLRFHKVDVHFLHPAVYAVS